MDAREPRREVGSAGNRLLNGLVESTAMNVRGFPETDGPSSQGGKPGKRRRCHSSRRSGKPATGRRAPGARRPQEKLAARWLKLPRHTAKSKGIRTHE